MEQRSVFLSLGRTHFRILYFLNLFLKKFNEKSRRVRKNLVFFISPDQDDPFGFSGKGLDQVDQVKSAGAFLSGLILPVPSIGLNGREGTGQGHGSR